MGIHLKDGKGFCRKVILIVFGMLLVVSNLPNSLFTPFAFAVGTGAGLKGEYYSNMNLTGLQLTRLDETVNFNWGEGSPINSIPIDKFSVRWTGSIQPLFSETYTLNVVTDDGVRLWVDGKLLIDSWVIQAGERVGTSIPFKAGQRYDIRIEYFENTGGASAVLYWSSASQTKQLYQKTNSTHLWRQRGRVCGANIMITWTSPI
ncbi:PA14 domain protein [compost metagenome]